MPFDGNGNFSLVPGTIVSEGMTVQPSQHNPPFQDVASGLSQVVLRSGVAPMTGNLNMNGNKISGVASGDQPGDVVTRADISDMAAAIGDGAWSVRDLGSNWLRRNGGMYDRASYPELAAHLPPLPDGVTWTQRASSTTFLIRGLTYADEQYLGVTNTTILHSLDGTSWSTLHTIAAVDMYDITFGAGLIVTVDGASGIIRTSLNGTTWTSRGAPTGTGLQGVLFKTDPSLFVAVGGSGGIATSSDGVSWTSRSSGVATTLYDVAFGNGLFVAVGASGEIVTSPDAIAWTSRVSGVSTALNSVAFRDGVFVAVGASGVIRTSTNGITWTPRSSGMTQALNVVLASSPGFMAAGAQGLIRISVDGASWAAATTGVTNQFYSGVVDPTNPNRYIIANNQVILDGLRTFASQFQVPSDDPEYGWIRAR